MQTTTSDFAVPHTTSEAFKLDMELSRRAQGCWTCKREPSPLEPSPCSFQPFSVQLTTCTERKIGCDRGYPACNNCLRTGRECLGYGIRLAWPDQPDGRRRVDRLPEYQFQLPATNSKYYGKQFINVTFADLAQARDGASPYHPALIRSQMRPSRLIPLLPNFHERETHLITYCEHWQRVPSVLSWAYR